ncbi:MAG TPA: GWxTD domain-containing protein, partial [Candidatus Eisenbacteria bacterium]|nr:GWxTD domain-containing protein [Candidatus Eisenbacteria bacterium]
MEGLCAMKSPLFILILILTTAAFSPPLSGYDEEALFERLDPDEQETLRVLHLLMNPFQQKQYLSLPSREARSAWVERFWLELDPTPTTARNERRIEHEQRLAYVRERFPSSEEPGWDRRGEIYILYGEPDSRQIIEAELVHPSVYPPKEKWHYRELNTYVTFEDLTHNGEYIYEILSYSTGRLKGSRGPEPDYNLSVFAGMPVVNIPSLDATEREFSNPRKQPYRHTCDLVMNKFPLYFDVSCFRGGAGTVMTEVSFEIPSKDILFIPGDGVSRGEVDFRVMVRNFSFDSVTAGATRVSAAVPGEETLQKLDHLAGQLRLPLEPGYYRFGIEAIDRNARRSCAYHTIVTVPGMDSRPALSDIQFARLIRDAGGEERFTKGNIQIVPH